jgi:hypothetical protein
MNGPAVVFYLGPSHFLTCPITIRGLEVTMGFVSAERRHLRLLVPRKKEIKFVFFINVGVFAYGPGHPHRVVDEKGSSELFPNLNE